MKRKPGEPLVTVVTIKKQVQFNEWSIMGNRKVEQRAQKSMSKGQDHGLNVLQQTNKN